MKIKQNGNWKYGRHEGGVRGVTLPWKMLCRQLPHGGKSHAFWKVVKFLYTNLSMSLINISSFRQFHGGINLTVSSSYIWYFQRSFRQTLQLVANILNFDCIHSHIMQQQNSCLDSWIVKICYNLSSWMGAYFLKAWALISNSKLPFDPKLTVGKTKIVSLCSQTLLLFHPVPIQVWCKKWRVSLCDGPD